MLDDVALHLKGFLYFFQLLFIIHAPQSRLNVATVVVVVDVVVVVAIVFCCSCRRPLRAASAVVAHRHFFFNYDSGSSLALALRCAAGKKLIRMALGGT